MDKPRISIIIPVYKVEQYLSECLESVLAQTYPEWECILVDDGSPDSSGSICDEYAAKDSRFKVIHQPNSGASTARNTGLQIASGEWIVFVDADDIVMSDYLQNMITAAQSHDVDFVIGGLQYWHTETDERNDKSYVPHKYEGEDIVKAYLSDHIHQNGGPVAKLYKRSIIIDHHIEFNPKMHYAEDCNFMMNYLNYINSIAFIDAVDYIYRMLPTSLSHRKMNLESEKVVLKEMSNRYEEVHARFLSEDLSILKVSLIQYYIRVINSLIGCNVSFIKKIKNIKQIINRFREMFPGPLYILYQPYCYNERLLLYFIRKNQVALIWFYLDILYPMSRVFLEIFKSKKQK